MEIAILGSGVVGQHLAKGWTSAGHRVMVSSRQPNSNKIKGLLAELNDRASAGTLKETFAFSSTIVIAIGWHSVAEVVPPLGDWEGKVVIDTTNRFTSNPVGKSAGEDMADMLPGAKVVKAFNTIGAELMPHGSINGEQLSMLYAGDDPDAKAHVAGLIQDVGFEPIDVGSIDKSGLLEQLAALWVSLAYGDYGRNIGFKLVRG